MIATKTTPSATEPANSEVEGSRPDIEDRPQAARGVEEEEEKDKEKGATEPDAIRPAPAVHELETDALYPTFQTHNLDGNGNTPLQDPAAGTKKAGTVASPWLLWAASFCAGLVLTVCLVLAVVGAVDRSEINLGECAVTGMDLRSSEYGCCDAGCCRRRLDGSMERHLDDDGIAQPDRDPPWAPTNGSLLENSLSPARRQLFGPAPTPDVGPSCSCYCRTCFNLVAETMYGEVRRRGIDGATMASKHPLGARSGADVFDEQAHRTDDTWLTRYTAAAHYTVRPFAEEIGCPDSACAASQLPDLEAAAYCGIEGEHCTCSGLAVYSYKLLDGHDDLDHATTMTIDGHDLDLATTLNGYDLTWSKLSYGTPFRCSDDFFGESPSYFIPEYGQPEAQDTSYCYCIPGYGQPVAENGTTVCATEGGMCSCDGMVRYGTNDCSDGVPSWSFWRAISGDVWCANGAFEDVC